MENLVSKLNGYNKQNLSEEEQRVCLLKEVEKYSEKERQSSGGLFTWLGGIAMDDSNEPIIPIETKETVDELWNRLFDYEQSKQCVLCRLIDFNMFISYD